MNLVIELNKSIIQSPILIQVASNGIWKDRWEIPFTAGMPSIEAIDQYLKEGAEGIMFEIFFKTEDGYSIILGVKFTEQLKTTTPREFLITSFQSIWSVTPPRFSAMILDISKKLTGNANSFFNTYPTDVTLGIINWWKSMERFQIWNNAKDKQIIRKTLRKQLQNYTHLLQNNKNYAAMESHYRGGYEYWVAIQVSDKKEEVWILNEDRVERLLSIYLNMVV